MEKLRLIDGQWVPGERETWDELAEHSLTHDDCPRPDADSPATRREDPFLVWHSMTTAGHGRRRIK